jgi:general secretion pathway protein I
MVAVAILGVGLTAIFAVQWGCFAYIRTSRNMAEATQLARCRMSEIEIDLDKDGFQLTDVADSGPCCDGEDNPRMSCTWSVERPEFPTADYGDLDLGADLDLKGGGPSLLPGIGGPGAAGPLSFMNTRERDVPKSGDIGDVADAYAGGADSMVDGMAQMVMAMVYPDLKNLFEGATRRVTVRVVWLEGQREHSVVIEQWVVNSKEVGLVNFGGLMPEGEEEDDTSASGSGEKKTPSGGGGAKGGGTKGGGMMGPRR